MAREFAKAFYSSKAWQDCRNAYIKSVHYLCEDCLAKGVYSPAKYVHHVEELTPVNIHCPEIATGFDNLRAVCRACHDEAHDNRGRWATINAARRQKKKESQRFTIDEFGRVMAKDSPPGE